MFVCVCVCGEGGGGGRNRGFTNRILARSRRDPGSSTHSGFNLRFGSLSQRVVKIPYVYTHKLRIILLI